MCTLYLLGQSKQREGGVLSMWDIRCKQGVVSTLLASSCLLATDAATDSWLCATGDVAGQCAVYDRRFLSVTRPVYLPVMPVVCNGGVARSQLILQLQLGLCVSSLPLLETQTLPRPWLSRLLARW